MLAPVTNPAVPAIFKNFLLLIFLLMFPPTVSVALVEMLPDSP
jgi:hypothetical protein